MLNFKIGGILITSEGLRLDEKFDVNVGRAA
jgi:hypothetical protein